MRVQPRLTLFSFVFPLSFFFFAWFHSFEAARARMWDGRKEKDVIGCAPQREGTADIRVFRTPSGSPNIFFLMAGTRERERERERERRHTRDHLSDQNVGTNETSEFLLRDGEKRTREEEKGRNERAQPGRPIFLFAECSWFKRTPPHKGEAKKKKDDHPHGEEYGSRNQTLRVRDDRDRLDRVRPRRVHTRWMDVRLRPGTATCAYECAALKTHADCLDKCGCGWCAHETTSDADACYTTYESHCVDGAFDDHSDCDSWNTVTGVGVIVLSIASGVVLLVACAATISLCCTK